MTWSLADRDDITAEMYRQADVRNTGCGQPCYVHNLCQNSGNLCLSFVLTLAVGGGGFF